MVGIRSQTGGTRVKLEFNGVNVRVDCGHEQIFGEEVFIVDWGQYQSLIGFRCQDVCCLWQSCLVSKSLLLEVLVRTSQ